MEQSICTYCLGYCKLSYYDYDARTDVFETCMKCEGTGILPVPSRVNRKYPSRETITTLMNNVVEIVRKKVSESSQRTSLKP